MYVIASVGSEELKIQRFPSVPDNQSTKYMYKKLFKKNKIALNFIKEKERLTGEEINSLSPISKTKLASKTIVGIADLITDFSKENKNKTIERVKNWLLINTSLDVEKIADLKQFLEKNNFQRPAL